MTVRLEGLEHQHLKEVVVIMRRNRPFGIVIGNIDGIAEIAPAAAWSYIVHVLSLWVVGDGRF